MKIRRTWVLLALLITAVTAVTLAMPGTLAYIIAGSNTVRNTFSSVYMPPEEVSVPVRVHKTVLGFGDDVISPGGFSFRLVNTETGEVQSMTTFTDGYATLMLPFTAEDVGKTYTYELYEIEGGRLNVTYDTTVYEIAITLSVDEENRMVGEMTIDGEPVDAIVAEFENLYTPVDIPDTGDNSQPLACLMMLLVSCVGLAVLVLNKNGSVIRRP